MPEHLRPGTTKRGDIVFLHPDRVSTPGFGGTLMVVEDVHVWGCQGFVQALGDSDAMGGMAYYRAIWSEMVGTGGSIAAYIPTEDEGES